MTAALSSFIFFAKTRRESRHFRVGRACGFEGGAKLVVS
jgi:hypothetical protein